MAKGDKKKSRKINFAELSDAELERYHQEFRKELQEIRFSQVTSAYTNNARISALKKDIARILTVKNQRKKQAAAK
ncbi:MAG: 50S ribosomal protein L29 [Turneriella sp.]|nr:50S ribosomal protein L29 [Leptospiraceae bacterium]MCX7633431.1 50S ribosomal protein L29 [Turneriella sp.]